MQWMVDIYIGGVRRRFLVGENKRNAELVLAKYRERKVLLEHGVPVYLGTRSPTLAEYAPRYLEHLEAAGRAQRTIAIRRHALNARLVPALGKVPLAQVTPKEVTAYVRDRLKAQAAPGSVGLEVSVLRHLLGVAAEEGEAPPPAKLRGPARRKAPPRYLSAGEVARLLDSTAAPGETGAYLRVALATGLRPGEVCALRWRDVDWSGSVRAWAGKVGKALHLPLPASVLAYLEPLRGALAAYLVLPGMEDRHRAHQAIAGRLVRLSARVGVQRVTPHLLRHTVASHMADPRLARDLLGHGSLATTDAYSHTSPEALRGAVEALPWHHRAPDGHHDLDDERKR